ncbi:MAG: hypothetical protein KDE53_40990 [Caldilineaceae bacterium]|nr:hypothetical protein [Caldilineaceae bacterium]
MQSSALGTDWHQQVSTAFLPSHPPDFTHLTLARLFIMQGAWDETLDLLTWLFSRAQAAGRVRSLVENLLLQALTLHQKDQPQRALSVLEEVGAMG